MKKLKLFLLLFATVAAAFSLNKVISDTKKEDLREQRAKIDYRIDNMGYWTGLAEKGIIPFNPDVKAEPAIFKGSKIKAYSVKDGDSPDVPVTGPGSQQSENSVIVDPQNASTVLNSNNSVSSSGYSVYGANYLYSFDVAETWEGNIHGPNGSNWGDPAVGIDNLGRWYVGYISSSGGQKVSYSDDQGQSWTAKTVANKPGSGWNDMCDKNHLWVDTKPGSPYENYVYDAWTDFGGQYDREVVFKRSTNRGQTWGPKLVLSLGVNAGSHNQGVNLSTGPNGEVYAVWSVYDNSSLTEKAIGFCKSTDGGASFTTAVRAINNIYGIRNIGVPQNMRVTSFPAAAVDISEGPYKGYIYIVWANRGVPGQNTGSDVDIYMIRSTDNGETWDTPVRVNQDPIGQGKKHYMPWIAVDPVTGIISVIFYDNRNTSAANKAEAWVAVSSNAGETWEDFRVSDVEFKPEPIPGLAGGYFGDYLGITAYDGKVYPVWTDNRTGKAMTYVSPFSTMIINNPYDLTAEPNHETGVIHLQWNHEQTDGFVQYKIYKDDVLIDTTNDLEYYDTLTDYAYVKYSVSAAYVGGAESMQVEINTQYGTSVASFTPDTLIKVIDIADTTGTAQVLVTNEGTLYLVYSYSPFNKNQYDVPEYGKASGGGDEYINRVTIGNIDNFTPYDGYYDFSDMPVTVEAGKSYTLQVEVKNPYYGDQCAVWIDWNNNGTFDEKPIMLQSDENAKVFTGKITVSDHDVYAYYKMRIRLAGPDDDLLPYGATQYGEVEDYLLVPNSWLSFMPLMDTVQVNDTSVINFNFNAVNMVPGIYSRDIKYDVTDLDTNQIVLHIVMNLSDLAVEAAASDSAVCSGSEVQLTATATGGNTGLYYEWSTLSGVFVSDEQNPVVTIDTNVTFVVAVHDSLYAVKYDTVSIEAFALPQVDLGMDTAFCGQADTAHIMLDAGNSGASYLWSTGDTTQTLTLNKEILGDYGEHEITVTVTNENGCSVSDTVIVNMKDCTSIDEQDQNMTVSVFPNPNNGIFMISLSNDGQETVNLKVISMNGAVVYSLDNLTVRQNTQKRIHLDNVSNGVYTILIQGKDYVTTQKIVVAR